MDIANELKSLTIDNYYETLLDNNDFGAIPFFVFGKIIKEKMVYIKIKIKHNNGNYIFCLSFHFSEFEMNIFPYKH